MTRLPGLLGDIADVAGYDAAMAIADARGGTQVYIPTAPDAEHWLSKLIGVEKALAVAERLTLGVCGARFDLPLGPVGAGARLRAEVDRLIAEGCSERDIALRTRYPIRSIRRRRALLGKPRDDRQLSLL